VPAAVRILREEPQRILEKYFPTEI